MPHAAPAPELTSEFSPLRLTLDPRTGMPAALARAEGERIRLHCAVAIVHGGTEARGEVGGLVYPTAETAGEVRVAGATTEHLLRDGRRFVVPVTIAGWLGEVQYTFRAAQPSLTWGWRLRPGATARAIRNITLTLTVDLDGEAWQVEAPGNRLRPHLPLADLSSAGTTISSIGGALGSAGVIALCQARPDAPRTLVIWPRSLDENGVSTLARTDGGVSIVHTLNVAASADAATDLGIEGVALDLVDDAWPQVSSRLPRWYDTIGVTTPRDRPEWTRYATIFEAQIGTSIFAGGTFTYSPYPQMVDLLDDLPRIHDLGFDTIQIMPRQPFPSYNVVDYDDIDLTWGDEADLRRVIDWCHERGMRVILDILLHGVLDQGSIGEAADAVRSGPWAQHCRATSEQLDALALSAADLNRLTWSRHILDFEEAWRTGSPAQHPLTVEHPEWFCTDSAGDIIGIYTRAFDMSNPQWQSWFIETAVGLVRRLGIDGFRFDAPGYNAFPNWSPRTRTRASVQQLGALTLFRRLRVALRELNPEAMLYTEENGPLWRQHMDLNYNYDEFWLPDSLFGAGSEHPPSRVRHGRDLAEWMRERDGSLPVGSVTAHHLDSHDSFWFLLPGRQWRREQFGIDAARALMHAYALSGGPYMMFVGGEQGMVDEIRRVNRLRSTRPELRDGVVVAQSADDDAIYARRHRSALTEAIIAVNLSAAPVTATLAAVSGTAVDALDDTAHDLACPITWAPFQARYLVIDR